MSIAFGGSWHEDDDPPVIGVRHIHESEIGKGVPIYEANLHPGTRAKLALHDELVAELRRHVCVHLASPFMKTMRDGKCVYGCENDAATVATLAKAEALE